MGWAEWIAIAGLALTVLGALAQIIWMLATLKKSVDVLCSEQTEAAEQIAKHAESCDPDRMRLGFRVLNLETKLADLFK